MEYASVEQVNTMQTFTEIPGAITRREGALRFGSACGGEEGEEWDQRTTEEHFEQGRFHGYCSRRGCEAFGSARRQSNFGAWNHCHIRYTMPCHSMIWSFP